MKKTTHHIEDILRIKDPGAVGGLKRRLIAFLQTVYQIGGSFVEHQGPLRAAALTYTSMLSMVPLLAIAFSVLKGLGAQNALEPLLLQVAGDSRETISRIISYVDNTNVKSLGAVGLLALVLTVVSLLERIEGAFNATWGVRQTRTFQRRFSDYLSVVVVGPILLLVATSMTTSLQSQWLVRWLIEHTYLGDTILLLFRMIPYLFIWLAMIFLYLFIPNTRVRLGSAILGGVLAGTAWQIAQWGYFHFQVGVAKYNAIYGTLAALPVFLVWVYTSWLIVLFGLEVVYAHQFRNTRAAQLRAGVQAATTREVLALSTLLLVCSHFRDDAPPPRAAALSDELAVPLSEVEELLETLRTLHFLAKVDDEGSGWLPARDPSAILLDDVMTALRGELPPPAECAPACGTAIEVLGRETGVRRESLKGVTIHDLIEGGKDKGSKKC